MIKSVEGCDRKWTKYEKEEVRLEKMYNRYKTKVHAITPSLFSRPEVMKEFDRL